MIGFCKTQTRLCQLYVSCNNMNLDAWKINDPDWVALREENWKEFSSWINRKLDGEEDEHSYLEDVKSGYYDKGVVDKVKLETKRMKYRVEHFLALHPELSVEDAREIFDLGEALGLETKASFHERWLYEELFYEFVQKGLLPEDFALTIVKAFYGDSFDDACSYLRLRPESEGKFVVSGLGKSLSSCIGDPGVRTSKVFVNQHMLPHYFEFLKRLPGDEAAFCQQTSKRLKKYIDKGLLVPNDSEWWSYVMSFVGFLRAAWPDIDGSVKPYFEFVLEYFDGLSCE